MRNQQNRGIFRFFPKLIKHLTFSPSIERRKRIIQNQQRLQICELPREREPLLLSAGQAHTPCADACFRRHFPFEPYSPQQRLHISCAAEQDIVFDRIAQKLRVMPQIADICASFCFIEGRKLAVVKPDRALIRIFAQKRLSEQTEQDNPPILLKNNKFARLFEFIGELYSLPNYREIDLTPFFAPFFVLFFGFCLGDAGYGLLLLLGITIYKFKAKPAIKPILSLAQWLGISTVIMGIVGGTFFGIQLLDVQVPWMEKMKAYMLDSQQLFNLALIVGAVQIIFGMFLKVANQWKQHGFAAALSTIGWLVLILGEGICYWLSTKGYAMDVPMYVVGAVAGLLIFVFNNVRRNVFINIGAGLWDSYNMVTGLLGDTLS